jgi:pimeloyl-ACP methyl ester carboxylesterase
MSEIVVFLPGIMGSELRLGGKRVWPGSVGSLIGSYKQMEELLLPNLEPVDIIRSFSVSEQYKALLDDLRKFGFEEKKNLLLFPYDWRKSNAEAAGKLAIRLDEIVAANAGAEVTLLAHSMGGLVSRYYLESGNFEARAGFAAVRRLITLGTPHRGAPLALSAAVGKEKRLFLSAEQVHRLASDERYPSLYQLLPPEDEPFAWDGGFGRKLAPLDVYDSANAKALGLSEKNLEAAKTFRAGLDFARRPANVRYFLFYGTRQTTISASSVRLDAAKPGDRVTNLEIEDGGDGTVPVWSGMGAGFQGRAVGGEHGSIHKNEELRRTLASLFAYTGTLAAETTVEVAVRDRVVEPEALLHISLSLGAGVSELKGSLLLERANLDAEGSAGAFVAQGAPEPLSYAGANVERINVTRDAPELAGLYRLTFLSTGGIPLGSDEFFVQEPE